MIGCHRSRLLNTDREVLMALLTAIPDAENVSIEKEIGYVFTVVTLPNGKRFRIEVGRDE